MRVWLERRGVGVWVTSRVGQRHSGCAILLIASLAHSANAAEFAVTIHCERFDYEQREELDARVRLLVHGAPSPTPASVAIACQEGASSVTLQFVDHARTGTLPIEGDAIEDVLSKVEELLEQRPTASEPRPSAAEASAAGGESKRVSPAQDAEPPPVAEASDNRPDPPPPEAGPSRTIGGASLGVSVEPWPAPAGVAVGPRLDVAFGVGSWAATSFESLRFGSTPDARLLAFDALVGVAWGAPFATQRAGAVLALGGEWFSAGAAAEPTGQRTASTFVVDFGLRWGETLGPAALWLGADGRFRARPPELPEPVLASLSRWSVIVSLGGALTVR